MLTAKQQIEEDNCQTIIEEAIVCNSMTKIQEAQSHIEMALEAKKRSSSQLDEVKAKKQKLN